MTSKPRAFQIRPLTECIPAILCLIMLLTGNQMLRAQPSPKRELRAAWIATVMNIDWPSGKGLSVAEQQHEFVRLLDTLKAVGMNAVIVQVRPVADAFYPSSYEPWTEYLSGTQGQHATPYYNPLAFMIAECRKRALEFHAWFNPYRASMNAEPVHADNHPIRKHPEWFVEYGGKYYYDPGHPEARQYVLRAIMETVRHYDLDAVHFDDYFYPYRIAGLEFPDSTSYATWGVHEFANKDDWRRNNVDLFVEELSRRINREKPHVKFGISPFGVWRNIDKDSTGSNTRAGQTNYDDLFADVLKWLREGWIDYITPQLYWHIGFEPADYKILIDWWSRNSYGKHLYIGQGIYRLGQKGWENPEELPNQIRLNRTYPTVNGSMYFSSKTFLQNKEGANATMRKIYPRKALVPAMPWKTGEVPDAPQLIRASGNPQDGIVLEWKDPVPSAAAYYVVYRFNKDQSPDIEDPTHLLDIIPRGSYPTQRWVDHSANRRQQYSYVITAVDRLHNESLPSAALRVKTRGKKRAVRLVSAP